MYLEEQYDDLFLLAIDFEPFRHKSATAGLRVPIGKR